MQEKDETKLSLSTLHRSNSNSAPAPAARAGVPSGKSSSAAEPSTVPATTPMSWLSACLREPETVRSMAMSEPKAA